VLATVCTVVQWAGLTWVAQGAHRPGAAGLARAGGLVAGGMLPAGAELAAEAGLATCVAWASVEREERDAQRFWLSVLDALRRTVAASAPAGALRRHAGTRHGADQLGWASTPGRRSADCRLTTPGSRRRAVVR
jgi:hypothetical protein